jgi:hypothetical protein
VLTAVRFVVVTVAALAPAASVEATRAVAMRESFFMVILLKGECWEKVLAMSGVAETALGNVGPRGQGEGVPTAHEEKRSARPFRGGHLTGALRDSHRRAHF